MKCVPLFAVFSLPFALFSALPEYVPPFQTNTLERKTPELKTENLVSKGKTVVRPYLLSGNKQIGLRKLDGRPRSDRDFIIAVLVDERDLFHLRFWGAAGKNNSGWPFADRKENPAKLETQANAIVYRKPYRLEDGTAAEFSFTIRPAGPGLVEVAWEPGIPAGKMTKYALSPWLEFSGTSDYRNHKISFDGKPFVPAGKDKFRTAGNRKSAVSFQGSVREILFDGILPDKKVAILLPEAYPARLIESEWIMTRGKAAPQAVFQLTADPRSANRKLLIDLGGSGNGGKTPPSVAGIDFWKHDATHIPASPVRNIFPNPSFRQGLRYFRWAHGGAKYTPSALPRYSVETGTGCHGGNALLIRPVQTNAAAPVSFALPLKKGTVYTVSCYAKAEKGGTLRMTPFSHSGKQFDHGFMARNLKQINFPLIPAWKRYVYTFRYQEGGVGILLNAHSGDAVRISDVQVEEGNKASPFVSAPLDGCLETSNPDNRIADGDKIEAKFRVFGEKGKVRLSLFDYYRKNLWSKTFDVKNGDTLPLPFDALRPGRGSFVLRADFLPEKGGGKTDYYRFNIMKFLSNEHATKNLFGTEMRSIGRISRADDLGRLFMQSGIGATVYGRINGWDDSVLKRWKIENLIAMMANHEGADPRIAEFVKYQRNEFRKLEKATPEALEKVENAAYLCAKDMPEAPRWALTGEIDKASAMLRAGRYDDYAKLLMAFARGIKRANPNAKLFPDAGTQAYKKIWGREETEAKIRATQGLIRWDAFATHPYASLDGTAAGPDDLDQDVCAHFIAMLNKYGYEKEPIYFIEAFNLIPAYVPEWNATWWGDGWQGGKIGYDWGLREFNQAAWIARGYLIALKYWPKVQHWNFWQHSPFFDCHLQPYSMLNAVNTLGNLFGNPKFEADIRPAPGIRAYVFRNERGEGIAGIWYISNSVENGLTAGPRLRIPCAGKPEVIDLMGNSRTFDLKNGALDLPLTAAPVFVKMKTPETLITALRKAEASGGEVSVNFNIRPDVSGDTVAEIYNLSGNPLNGTLKTDGISVPFAIPGNGRTEQILKKNVTPEFGKMYSLKNTFKAELKDGSSLEKNWKMEYFYIPYVPDVPDWNTIPSIPLDSRHTAKGNRFTGKNDLNASFKTAWNGKNFYLRVEAEDDRVIPDPERFKRSGFLSELYWFDACLEVYFDCGANGLFNNRTGYDDDDYRYDFAPGTPDASSGPGLVYRRTAAHAQLAGGLDMPSKEKASKNIRCNFKRTSKGYVYEIVFEQPYIEPLLLKTGRQFGFGLYLHDKDSQHDPTGSKGISNSVEKGVHINHKPHLWPRGILRK